MKKRPASVDATTPQRPEDEYLGVGRSLAYGLQHVLTMYGGVIAVPLIIGTAAGLDATETGILVAAALFIGGLATILQSIGVPFLGAQLPLVQGVSFAGVATMLTILQGTPGEEGLRVIFGAVLVASALGFILAPFFAKIIRFFPPVVSGVVITTIGVTLMPVAAGWSLGPEGDPAHGSVANIGLAAFTLLMVLLLSKVGSAAISRLSILLAIVIGTIVAALLGRANFSGVGEGPVIGFPTPFEFGTPLFVASAILGMFIVIIVTMTETTADIVAVGEIAETGVDSKRIANGLRADMLSSTVAPLFNTFTQTAFAQNVGLVAITGIRSRFVVAGAGVIMVVLGLLPVLGRVVAAVPSPVLGGAGIVLFGTVAASGIRTLAGVDYRSGLNLIVVAVSMAMGLIPVVSPTFYDQFPSWVQVVLGSGISAAALTAVLLNILFNELRFGSRPGSSELAAYPPRVFPKSILQGLQEGDTLVNGRLIGADGQEIAVVDDHLVDEARRRVETGELTDTGQIHRVYKRDGL
ncbi:nucleobase:cation symporter-2 family protein [Kocuria sp. WRN011]|uniref:nucleobase:cation symporter-2 family protein n=1 Tax=Kocuria sp. WRN011 TaxID=2029858 RepID=UPI0020B118EF|nr:nucleobase:cation symporter-2 family protein [Kocuria sp. WRN011]